MTRPLAELVALRGRFLRSANVERDVSGDSDLLDGYVPTPPALDVVRAVSGSLSRTHDARAISVTGPYGSGKSSLALFLDALCGPTREARFRRARSLLRASDEGLAEAFLAGRKAIGVGSGGFVRAAVTAQREPLPALLIRALRIGAERYVGSETLARRVPELRDLYDAGSLQLSATELRRVVQAVTGLAPVLLLVDEFGRVLDHYASGSDPDADIGCLQDLAEWSVGPTGMPLLTVTLQHLAFEEYAAEAPTHRRLEWGKVQGRFLDVGFVPSPGAAQQLLAAALDPAKDRGFGRSLSSWGRTMRGLVDEAGLATLVHVDPVDAYPLHPLTLAVLPELCNRYGQAERTMLSFLSGPEPTTVRSFLAGARTGRPLPSVRLHHVYAYFVESAPSLFGAAPGASRWIEIETRLRDAAGLSAAQLRVARTVGVLNLVAAGGTVRATRKLVLLAADDGIEGTESERAVSERLDELLAAGVLTYREFADEYRVWLGSDFDVRGAVDSARRRVAASSLATTLKQIRPLPPLVAARHSQQGGTLRVFERHYVGDVAELSSLVPDPQADGVLAFWVGPEPPPLEGTDESTGERGLGDRPVVLVVPERVVSVEAAAHEYAALRLVLDESEQVESDWVAGNELRERAALAASALDLAIESGFRAPAQTRCLGGFSVDAVSFGSRGLSGLISGVCDLAYGQAPVIRNEMIARRVLTSQGAKARRLLLGAMVEASGVERCGITGYGPERAMYEALLFETGIHGPHHGSNGSWAFGTPHAEGLGGSFQPLWEHVQRRLDAAVHERLPADRLFAELTAPPFGLKAGPVPVLVAAALLVRNDDVAIYEEGSFRPRLTADLLERMVRNPERYAFRCVALHGARVGFLGALAQALGVRVRWSPGRRVGGVVSVVAPLLAAVAGLPRYAKRTSELGSEAQAVRDALLSAREPDHLLFDALPSAVGAAPIAPEHDLDATRAAEVAGRISRAVDELVRCYGRMLDGLAADLTQSFPAPAGREALRARAARLTGQLLDSQLRPFVHALGDQQLDDEQWLAHLGLVVANRPATEWDDADRARFRAELRVLARSFARLEALHHERGRRAPVDGVDAVRLTATMPDGQDAERVVWLDRSLVPGADAMVTQAIERSLREFGPGGPEVLLAELARRVLFTGDRAGDGQSPGEQVAGGDRGA